MKRLTLLPGLLFLMLQAAFSQESGSCKPVNLVCDYLVNPLGIDNPAPRLSWMLNDARKGARQTACQVIVDKDSLELIAGKGTIWDSGKKDWNTGKGLGLAITKILITVLLPISGKCLMHERRYGRQGHILP